MVFGFAEVAEGGTGLLKTTADAVGVVGLVGQSVHRDNDPIESGTY